ncbi:MAG: ABC transporter permease subunit [Bacteroidetes bacterium]|nr:ABC transporter permease subunit [Bacteroidota bacterium]
MKMKGKGLHSTSIITIVSALILLIVWYAAARIINLPIILPTPLEAFKALIVYLGTESFWQAVGATSMRAVRSFLITLAAGTAAGLAAGWIPGVRAALSPLVTVVRTIPVMSVILLAFIWFSSGTVPVFAAFLMSFPILFENVFAGVVQTDKKLLEMGQLYRLNTSQQLYHITIPSLVPYLIAGARGTIGMTWKVVIAAEVLTVPRKGIGSGMQFSQINLETGEVMAWTVAAILLSAASQGIFKLMLAIVRRKRFPGRLRNDY